MERTPMVIDNITEEKLPGADIRVIGVGGGGCNAVNTMVSSGISKVTFISANTDHQALENSLAPYKIHLGRKTSRGLGAGGDPTAGRNAAVEETKFVAEALEGADMVFVTAGMGGGTGTGAAPVIAGIAKEQGALVVGVVSRPFIFEGRKRAVTAEMGIDKLRGCVDTLIVIPNDRIMQTVERQTSFKEAFRVADDVLRKAVQGISDVINVKGLINRDFADVKSVMETAGMAIIGMGQGRGSNKAIEAVESAIFSPLLDDITIEGAQSILLIVTGGNDITMWDVNDAASKINEYAHKEADIKFGAVINDNLEDEMRLTIIATRFQGQTARMPAKVVNFEPVVNLDGRKIVNRRTAQEERMNRVSSPVQEPRYAVGGGFPVRGGTIDTPTAIREGSD